MGPYLGPLSACLASRCEKDCGLSCGGLAGFETSPANAMACQDCLDQNGCDVERACAVSVDCEANSQECIRACDTLDCLDTCEVAHGSRSAGAIAIHDADAGFWQVHSAVYGVCAGPCGAGQLWSCLGHVNWPVQKSSTTAIDAHLIDGLSGTPAQGVDVTACNLFDPTCAQPLAHATTDAMGHAMLQVQYSTGIGNRGLQGFLESTSSSSSYMPYLSYWGFPLSEAQYGFNWNIITPSENQTLFSSVSVTQDPMRGQLYVIAFDCTFTEAPGVVITTDLPPDSGAGEYYGLSGNPMQKTTDTMGTAYFSNVPVGTVHLTATPVGLGKPSATATVEVRAGWITEASMFPMP
jgi:hypothetical protein